MSGIVVLFGCHVNGRAHVGGNRHVDGLRLRLGDPEIGDLQLRLFGIRVDDKNVFGLDVPVDDGLVGITQGGADLADQVLHFLQCELLVVLLPFIDEFPQGNPFDPFHGEIQYLVGGFPDIVHTHDVFVDQLLGGCDFLLEPGDRFFVVEVGRQDDFEGLHIV